MIAPRIRALIVGPAILIALAGPGSLAGWPPTDIRAASAAASTAAFSAGSPGLILRVALQFGDGALSAAAIEGEGVLRTARETLPVARRVEVAVQAGAPALIRVDGVLADVLLPLHVSPRDPATPLVFSGVPWRGAFEIAPDGRGLRVINLVELEEYVQGVVPNEIFADPVAYKVQAIVSRTVAVYITHVERRWQSLGFSLVADGRDQVYRGMSSETAQSNQAVEETAGLVLAHAGRPIFAAFDSNAGGHTEVVDIVWPGSVRERFPYLAAVPSPHDRAALALPRYEWAWEWNRTLSWSEVSGLLAKAGIALGDVRSARAFYSGASRRVAGVEFFSAGGMAALRGADRIRFALDIPGARATITTTHAGLRIAGAGLGHGVGLSQHGAWGMAQAGYRAEEILRHYYRDVQIARFDRRMIER